MCSQTEAIVTGSAAVSIPHDVAVRLDSLLSALLHHHTSLEKPEERAEAEALIVVVRRAYGG